MGSGGTDPTQDAWIETLRGIASNIDSKDEPDTSGALLALLNSVPAAIGVVRDGTLAWVNSRMESITGYLREELLGKRFSRLYLSEEESERVFLDQTTRAGVVEKDTLWKRRDGTVVSVRLRWSALDPKVPERSFVFTALEITSRVSGEMDIDFLYRAIETSMHAVIICDLDLNIEWVNGEFLRKFDLEDIGAAKKISIRSLLEDPECIEDPMLELMKTGRWQGELRFRLSDGIMIDTLVTATILPDTGGVPWKIIASGMDITEEKLAENALSESEESFRAVFETAKDSIFIKDRSLRYTRVNPAMEQLFGLTASELIGKTDEDLFGPEAGAHIREVDSRVLDGKTIEEEHTKPVKGIEKTFHVIKVPIYGTSGEVTGICGIARDITERKRAEEERRRLATAIEQAAEIIVITDAEAMIQYVNPAFERVTGYSRDEVIGRNPRILQSGSHDDAFYKEMWNTLTRGETWSGRFINKKKDETLYTEELTISPVRDSSGETVNYVAVKRDITEEIRLEDQLRQAQKMEAVGQLAGGVAHDFNNLLQVINGYTEMALGDLESSHPAHSSIEEVARAGNRARTLVSQLLLFSRRQIINPVDLDLNEVIINLIKMIKRVIGEHIEYDFIQGQGLETVHADRGQMEQVLMNLCVNSRDAMPDGGTITIETRNVLINGEYIKTHPWVRPGRFVLLSITDTGCGMDKETLSSVFDPFFTTKEVGKGTGLGLSTVYGIVKQHDGEIQVYSEVSKGTVFKVYLPAVENRTPKVSSSVQGSAVGGTETILVAEDDDTVRNLNVKTLERAGYTVLDAGDGEEAVRLFEVHADEIALAVLDVVMPGLGGRQVHDRMKEIRPGVRVLFSSGYSHNAIHTSFVLDEGLQLIQKPYGPDALIRRVREVLDT